MRVLIVEDEKKLASFVRKALQAEGFAADLLHHGDEALAAATTTAFDVIILDIMLPGRDGLSVVRQLRARHVVTPVLLLTARGEVNERVEGLNAGADDYLPKPFVLAELIARVPPAGLRARRVPHPRARLFTRLRAWRGARRIETDQLLGEEALARVGEAVQQRRGRPERVAGLLLELEQLVA